MTETRWTLSGFGDEIDRDPHVQVAVLQALGANHIEVRSAWGTNIVDLDGDQLAALHQVFTDREMSVSAIASPVGKVDVALPIQHEVDRLTSAIRAAHLLGTRYIRIFSFYRAEGVTVESIRDDVLVRMRALADLAEDNDVILLHENEKDIYGDTPRRCLDIIESVGSTSLRVAWDSANFIQVGETSLVREGYEVLRPYLEYLQVKDALSSTGQVTPAGLGDGQLLQTLVALRDDGYAGFASLEPHLTDVNALGGFSGATAFGVAARAFRELTDTIGVQLV